MIAVGDAGSLLRGTGRPGGRSRPDPEEIVGDEPDGVERPHLREHQQGTQTEDHDGSDRHRLAPETVAELTAAT